MAHLVLDVLVVHELDLSIAASEIAARADEWRRVLTARSRAEYVKGIFAFAGMELTDYDNADVRRDQAGNFRAKVRSKHWTARQPA
jgi:hypothetical protein